ADAVPVVGVGDPERDLRVRDPRRAAVAARPQAQILPELPRQAGGGVMINLHWLYVLAGAMFAGFAIGSARDETNVKRWGNAAFWGVLTISFWFGDFLGDMGNGMLVLALVGIAGAHLLGRGSKQSTTAAERERFS